MSDLDDTATIHVEPVEHIDPEPEPDESRTPVWVRLVVAVGAGWLIGRAIARLLSERRALEVTT